MSKTISFIGGKASATVFSATGAAVPFPVFSIPPSFKTIGGVGGDGNPAALYAAFTPSNTTVTINPTGENAVTFTNATAREYLCTTNPLAGAYYYFARARRKPGTTGDIAAQAVTLSVNSVTIGKFNVASAIGPADPVSGFVSAFYAGNDTRVDLATHNLTVTVTAADADLEIELIIIGYQD